MSDRPTPGHEDKPRTWTIWRCDNCGDFPEVELGEVCEFCCEGVQREVEVVEASALDHWQARSQGLEEALREAADDLDKAANQFASIHESQQHGHSPEIRANHHIFAQKAHRARLPLSLGLPDEEGQTDVASSAGSSNEKAGSVEASVRDVTGEGER